MTLKRSRSGRAAWRAAALFVFLTAACGGLLATGGPTATPVGEINFPVAMAFAPVGRLFFTEKYGAGAGDQRRRSASAAAGDRLAHRCRRRARPARDRRGMLYITVGTTNNIYIANEPDSPQGKIHRVLTSCLAARSGTAGWGTQRRPG